VTIGALARPIDSTRLPKRRPSDGTNPVHHCKASNIVKRHNHTEVQTTAAWATPCHGFILDPLSLRAERCITPVGTNLLRHENSKSSFKILKGQHVTEKEVQEVVGVIIKTSRKVLISVRLFGIYL
jgi:hypothetical protein